MKSKKLLAIIAPAMLLASCGGNNKTTTTISKINLTGVKTLAMGQLNTSSNNSESNDEEEDLISVDEDGNASETEVDVTTGTKTTKTTNIKISRLVKLNKEYAVVSCTYNDVTYDLIVNLTDGTCVKFPDSSLLPNSKEKLGKNLGGHRKYRKYHKQYGYLNNTVIQPNEDVKLFYYVNHYQCAATDESVYARRLVVLDLTGETASAKAIVTPKDNHSVQTFAVDNNGNVIYFATNTEKVNEGTTVFDNPKLHYDDNKDDVEVTFDDTTYTKIAPYLITGNDSKIYCYLVNESNKYIMASINIDTTADPATAVAAPVETDTPTEVTEPDKILTIKGTDSSKQSVVNIVSVSSTGSKLNQLFSFNRNKHTLFQFNNNLSADKPSPKPSPWGKKDEKPSPKDIGTESGVTTLSTIEDGYSGNTYSYLFGTSTGSSKKQFRKVKLEDGKYTYIQSILSDYFAQASDDADVAEVEVDESSDDTTVVVEDGNSEAVYVTDDITGTSTKIKNLTNVSDLVDINN